jgi:hypothetical protein
MHDARSRIEGSQHGPGTAQIGSLDTREKIVPVLGRTPSIRRVVVGYFDPLTPAHVERLNELASGPRSLAVLVTDPAEPLLKREARVELVAALAVVGEVAGVSPEDVGKALEQLQSVEVIREEIHDAERQKQLIRHIHAKQALASSSASK